MKKLFLFLFLVAANFIYAQDTAYFPFANPLPGDLQISGTYGEIRDNHFHSGIDLKTNGKIGIPVLAAADGYVSRIKVSETGFGKVIYLTHKKGFVTVYAHLHKLIEKIDTVAYNEQLNKKSFDIELFPAKDKYIFKQGDTIAFSGNSGGSDAPHLHFEIRDEKTEKPINPTPNYIHPLDTIRPVVTRIYIFSINDDFSKIDTLTSFVPYSYNHAHFFAKGQIQVSGRIGIGFSGYDKATNDSNILGFTEAVLLLNNDTAYWLNLKNFSFDEKRFVNAHIDYAAKINSDSIIQRCFVLPNDYFSQYVAPKVSPVFDIDFMKEANMLLYLRDASGKLISVRFQLISSTAPVLSIAAPTTSAMHEELIVEDAEASGEQKKPGNYKTQNASIELSEGSFYRNVIFSMNESESEKNFYSSIISVYKETEPLQKPALLHVKPRNLSESLQSKALLVKIKNENRFPITSSFANGMVSGRINSLGNYAVVIDDVSPVIENITLGFDSVYQNPIVIVPVTDNLAGIKSHTCFINDEWALSEYIQKENKIICHVKNKNLQKFSFKIKVEDAKANSTEKSTRLEVENKSEK